MAEFLTHEDAKCKFGSKSKTNAALTLGIIGTSLAALNGGALGGDGNGGGILGGLLGHGNNSLAQRAMQMAILQGQQADNLSWSNRVQSMQDDLDMFSYVDGKLEQLNTRNFEGRIEDLHEKSKMYIDLLTRDNVQNVEVAKTFAATREKDLHEKVEIYDKLATRINELEKREAATQAAIPLMFELVQVKANKYTDDCCCAAAQQRLISDANLQRQIDTKITGTLRYAYSDLCAPVPNISPLYCTPFTRQGGWYEGQDCNCANK